MRECGDRKTQSGDGLTDSDARQKGRFLENVRFFAENALNFGTKDSLFPNDPEGGINSILMKKLLLALTIGVATFGVVAGSFAQGAGPQGGPPGGRQGGPGGRGGNPAERMNRRNMMEDGIFAKLNLSADQKAKIKKLRETRDAKFKKLFASMPKGGPGGPPPGGPGGPPPGGRPGGPGGPGRPGGGGGFGQFRPIAEEYRKGLDGVFKPEQKKKYEEAVKEARAKMGMGGGRRGPGGPGGPGGPPPGGRPGGR